MINGSIFTNVRDNQPWPIPPISFSELVEALTSEAAECDPTAKTDQICISPATYGVGETRSKARAISWDWFGADIDNKSGNLIGSSIDDIIEVMRGLGTPWFIYTTASSKPSAECFRVMFPLDRPIVNGEFDIVWQSFSRLLPIDPQTKDISRLFIVPRQWAGRANRIEFAMTGSPVEVDDIVARFPPPALPTVLPIPVAVPFVRKVTCPYVAPCLAAHYVPERAVSEALTTPAGGRMYRFLVAVAFSALRSGHDIASDDLEAVGIELAAMMSRGILDIRRDAQSALRYAESHFIAERGHKFNRLQAACLPKGLR